MEHQLIGPDGEIKSLIPRHFDDIKSDKECKEVLEEIKSIIALNAKDIKVIDNCIEITDLCTDGEIQFGPFEILSITDMCMKHPDISEKLTRCLSFLCKSVTFEGKIPIDFSGNMEQMYGAIGNIISEDVDDSEEEFIEDDEDFIEVDVETTDTFQMPFFSEAIDEIKDGKEEV